MIDNRFKLLYTFVLKKFVLTVDDNFGTSYVGRGALWVSFTLSLFLILFFVGAFKNFKYRTKVQLAKSPHIDPADIDALVLVEWRREVKKAQEKRQREELLGTAQSFDFQFTLIIGLNP